ncbi:MAG: ion transporter [Candidatus Liptonbacteria bacterium]|nr:ion transporter [Candidatus Liptonbacteria bacterium]
MEREKIHNFFENPTTFAGKFVQAFVMLLIIISVAVVATEFLYADVFERFSVTFLVIEHIALVVFTVEYVLRVFSAPQRLRFALKPMSIVDFLAIFPNYLDFFLHLFPGTTAIRAVRLIRLLRFLRILKLFRYGSFFGKIFQYQNTIFERITPVLGLLVVLKGGIWFLESRGWWISGAELGELFAIIGFALGIILSQKIGVSYGKFIQVEETVVRIYGKLLSLSNLFLHRNQQGGRAVCREWSRAFLQSLRAQSADHAFLPEASRALYNEIAVIEPNPSELAILYAGLEEDAAFAISKKSRLTPRAYDTLLHQATVFYLGLVAIFIPGATGMVSVLVAAYILYGMYRLTQDLDSILGGEYNLINIDLSELENFAAEDTI